MSSRKGRGAKWENRGSSGFSAGGRSFFSSAVLSLAVLSPLLLGGCTLSSDPQPPKEKIDHANYYTMEDLERIYEEMNRPVPEYPPIPKQRRDMYRQIDRIFRDVDNYKRRLRGSYFRYADSRTGKNAPLKKSKKGKGSSSRAPSRRKSPTSPLPKFF